jgi:cysteine-rich repeat protein
VVDWIYGNIVVDRDIFGPGPDWGMSIHRDGPADDQAVLRFGTEDGVPGVGAHTLQGLRHVLDGAWHHVAFVRERGSGVKRIYVDGTLDVASAPGASTSDLSYPNGRPTSYPASDPFLVFAAEKHGFSGLGPFPSFNGWLDEIRIWNVARTAAEIDAAKDQPLAPGTPGLVLHLRLEEGGGGSLADATGGNTATLHAGLPGNGEWSGETPGGAASTCGDGGLDALEECDDGGVEDGDGCDRFCRLELAARMQADLPAAMAAVDALIADPTTPASALLALATARQRLEAALAQVVAADPRLRRRGLRQVRAGLRTLGRAGRAGAAVAGIEGALLDALRAAGASEVGRTACGGVFACLQRRQRAAARLASGDTRRAAGRLVAAAAHYGAAILDALAAQAAAS